MVLRYKELVGNKRTHAYGEGFNSIPWHKRVIDESREEEIILGLAEYLFESFSNNKGRKDWPPNKYTSIAKYIFEGMKEEDRKKLQIARENIPFVPKNQLQINQIINNAVKSGYIQDIQLNDPWHPKTFFDENKITTYPYQHSTAILYSGKKKHIFYSQEFCDKLVEKKDYDRYFRHESILNKGYLKTGNRHGEENGVTGYSEAIFCNAALNAHPPGYTGGEKSYNGEKIHDDGVILEIQVPTQYLVISDRKGSDHEMKSIKDLQNYFETPENLRKNLKRRKNNFEYLITRNVPNEWITGVWDVELFKPNSSPKFLTLEEYSKWLYQEYYEYMPKNPDHSDVNKKINTSRGQLQNELQYINFLGNSVKELRDLYERAAEQIVFIKRKADFSKSDLNNFSETFRQLFSQIESVISEIRQTVKARFNVDLPNQTIVQDIGEFSNFVGGFKNGSENYKIDFYYLNNILEEIEALKRDLTGVMDSKHKNKDINSHLNCEKKLEKRILKQIIKLPALKIQPEKIVDSMEQIDSPSKS